VCEGNAVHVCDISDTAGCREQRRERHVRSVDGQAAGYRRDKKARLQTIKMFSIEKAEALKSATVPKRICAMSMSPPTVAQRTGTSDVVDVANARTTAVHRFFLLIFEQYVCKTAIDIP